MSGEIIKGSIKTYAPEGLDVLIYGKNSSGVSKVASISTNPLAPSPGFNVLCVGGNSGHDNTNLLPMPINIDSNSHTGIPILGTTDQTQQSSAYLRTLPINDTSGNNNVNVIDKNSNKISGGGSSGVANVNEFTSQIITTNTANITNDLGGAINNINSQGYTYINHTVTHIPGGLPDILITLIYTTNP